MKNNGWIVDNYGIFVYPTLSVTRSESIKKWLGSRPRSYWRYKQSSGAVKCVKVAIDPIV